MQYILKGGSQASYTSCSGHLLTDNLCYKVFDNVQNNYKVALYYTNMNLPSISPE